LEEFSKGWNINYANTKGFYINRAFGGDRYNRIIDVDFNAGHAASEGASQNNRVLIEPQAVESGLCDVYGIQ